MSHKNPEVDPCFRNAKQWKKELAALREIALESDLSEELKWSQPCYTAHGGNIVIIHSFSDNFGFGFFKGVLLKDPKAILEKPGPNTRSARMVRLTSMAELEELRPTLKKYIREAVALEREGAQVDFEKDRAVEIPEEIEQKFVGDAKLKKAFDALTPGRQRGYMIFFTGAKQPKTRLARIDKHRERILAGKGIHDR